MRPNTCPLIRPLPPGPLDIVGDVHGEGQALDALLQQLGYDKQGRHPQGRRLVFVGDLIDRGPDSVAVLERVMPMVDAGRAHCVMGNHELNLLRQDRKPASDQRWFHHATPADRSMPMHLLPDHRRPEVADWIASLPLALERDDLRVVHACWHAPSIESIRSFSGQAHDAYTHFKHRIKTQLTQGERTQANKLKLQNDNPVKVLTSGLERAADKPFTIKGRTHHEVRRRWWLRYADAPFVAFGHYWRLHLSQDHPRMQTMDEGNVFRGIAPHDLLADGKAMCLDYSIGGHYLHRQNPKDPPGHLAAFRWPEKQLVLISHDGISACS